MSFELYVNSCDLWLLDLQWIPPYPKKLIQVKRFFDISKGRLTIVEIEQKPEDLSKLKEWIEYREEIGKPLTVARTYLIDAKEYAICIKMHDDDYPVFITTPDYDVYVKRTAFTKPFKIRPTLRYVLTYSGYKLKYKYTKVRAKRYKVTKQTELNHVPCLHDNTQI